ncbi:MAG: putative Ig domain-containing protein [Saprospiraceae bacterium]
MNTKMLLRFIIPFFIAVGLPILAKATHIVGGEITYECLGNNRYELTLKVYRDCFFGREPFDNPGYIGIYNLRGDLIQTVLVRPGARDTLEPTLDDPCLVVPPNVCVDTVTYKSVVTLSNNPVGGAYQITYVRCCRNETIDNIIDPVETGAVYDIYLTREAMLQCNNSPVFNKLPPNYICADKPFVFDHSATDPDGDSLVYKLCTPYSGGSISNPRPIPPRNPPPFDEVIWQIGFGLDNLFGMGQPLRIDEETGRLTAVPGLQGQFVVGVCVEEYDRETGQLLSTVRRDFQYNVGVCGTKVAAFFAPETSCEPSVKFDNQSNNAESFRWYFDYPRTNLTSTEKSPTFTFPRPGTYNVALIADPGSICADTSIKQIIIRENTIDIDFQIEELECQSETILNLGDRSTDPNSPINKWEWTITYGDQVVRTSTERNPTFVVPSGSQGTIRLKVTTADGCSKTLEKPFETGINPPPIDLIPDTIIACQGSRIELNPDAPNNSNLVYRWSPSNLVSDANAANPLFTGTQSATLTVRITQGGTSCELSKQVRVIINTPPRVNLGQNQEICLRDTVTLTANVTGGRAPYQFAWNRGSGQSQRVSPVLSTTYIVTVTDANGCSDVDSVRVNVNAVPGVIVGADDTSICAGDSTTIRATVNAGTPPLTFRWNQGLSNAASHIVRPTQTTTYAVTVTDANGCAASDDIRINVSARPTLSIDTVFCNANLTNYQVNIRTNASSVRASAGTVINNNDGTFSIVNIPNGQNVRITAIANNCETIINVNAPTCVCPEVAAPISMGNRTICQGEAPPLLIVTVPNGQTVDWFDAPSGGNLLLEGNNSFMPTQPGTYYARARDLATGCTSATRTAVTFSVNPSPSATASASLTTVCAGDMVQLTAAASGGTAPYEFRWNQALGQEQNPVATPFVTTVYTVTVTDANGCRDTASVTINVDPLPRIDSIRTTCSQDLMTYSVRVVTNGNTVTSNVGTVTSLGGGVFIISDIPISQNLVFVATFNATNCGRRVSVNRPDCQCPDVDSPISGGDETICAGQPIPTLSVTVGPNQTADWYSAETGGDTLLLGSTSFTPTQAGIYYAVARDTITQCTSRVRTAVRLVINTALRVNATASETEICEGQSADLSATVSGGTPPFTYNWNQNLGSGQNKTVRPTQTTTYIVTVSDGAGCTGMDTITIRVNPRPDVTINADQDTICAGELLTLTASATGGDSPYTFNWNQGLGSGATQTTRPTQTTTYQVIVNDENSCSDTTQIRIVVNPKLAVQLTANRTTICAGDTTMLMAAASGGTAPYTFNWSAGGLSGQNPTVNPTATTTYTVTVTDRNGCSDTASITINVTQGLEVEIAANDATLCPGESAELSVNVGNGTRPYTYRWNQGLPADSTQTVMPMQTTTYSVTVTDANGCSGTDDLIITVNPVPSVEATASDTTICAGTSTNLSATASGGTGPYTFTWNPGNLSGQNQTVNPNDTTIYTVVVTDANGCMNSDQITIFVTPQPRVSIGASDMTICAGDSTTLTATANGGLPPYTFNWDNGLGTGANKTVTPTQTTTYTVTVTDANDCESTASVTINVSPALNVSISATQENICQGDSTTLTVTVSGGSAPYTFRWNEALNNNASQTIRPTETTTYSVTVTDANGCTGTAQITITVNPRPVVMIATDKDMICAGEAVTLTAEASGTGNLSYRWSNGAQGREQTVNPTETTTYVVTVTDSNGCFGVDSVTVTVNPRPSASIQASPSTICLGGASTLVVTSTSGTAPYTYEWDQNLGTNDTVIVRPMQTTTYTVTVTDGNGCRDTAQITITVSDGLNVTITADDETLCAGESTRLTVNSDGSTPFTYTWNQGLPGNRTQTVSPTQTTTYRVTVTDANGCMGMDSITITVSPSPTVQVSADRDTICAGDAVTLTAQGAGGTGNLSYRWSNGVTGATQVVNPTQTTTYTVTVTDANGCTNQDSAAASVTIVVNPRPNVNIQASPTTICTGGTSTLIVSATSGTAPYTYQWDQNLGTNDTVRVSPTQTTTYNVTVTDANGCTNTASITITVRSGLNVSITADDETLCAGQSANLRVTSDGTAPFTFVWNQNLPANSTQTVTPAQTTTYRVTVTDVNGCSGTDDITITVNPKPEISLTADRDTICAGDSVSMSVQVTGGTSPLTFIWSNGFGGADQVVRPTTTTTYSLTVTDANGCSDTAQVTIRVNPRPVVNAGPDTLSCSGSAVTLNATATNGTTPYTFNWDQNLGVTILMQFL